MTKTGIIHFFQDGAKKGKFKRDALRSISPRRLFGSIDSGKRESSNTASGQANQRVPQM
jgi:hypothetical protein